MGDVVINEVALDREVQRVADHEVDLVHGLGRERRSRSTPRCEKASVEPVEMVSPKGAEGNRSDGRDDVLVGHPGVPVGSARAHGHALAWEPCLGQEVPDGHRPGCLR